MFCQLRHTPPLPAPALPAVWGETALGLPISTFALVLPKSTFVFPKSTFAESALALARACPLTTIVATRAGSRAELACPLVDARLVLHRLVLSQVVVSILQCL